MVQRKKDESGFLAALFSGQKMPNEATRPRRLARGFPPPAGLRRAPTLNRYI
jgi:hypothetical protein